MAGFMCLKKHYVPEKTKVNIIFIESVSLVPKNIDLKFNLVTVKSIASLTILWVSMKPFRNSTFLVYSFIASGLGLLLNKIKFQENGKATKLFRKKY